MSVIWRGCRLTLFILGINFTQHMYFRGSNIETLHHTILHDLNRVRLAQEASSADLFFL